MHACIHICIHTYKRGGGARGERAPSSIHTYTYTHIHIHIRIRIHIRIHIHIHIHIYIHRQAGTCKRTASCTSCASSSPPPRHVVDHIRPGLHCCPRHTRPECVHANRHLVCVYPSFCLCHLARTRVCLHAPAAPSPVAVEAFCVLVQFSSAY